MIAAGQKLDRAFYAQDTLTVAQQLLGQRLVRLRRGKRMSGRIVETEAYCGPTDPASHARFGPHSRAAPMFGEPGHAYIYFTYGMYYCMNAITEPAGSGTGVLLRSLEPTEGLDEMRKLRSIARPGKSIPDRQLANGPGKLCLALAIDTRLNQSDLTGEELWIEADEPVNARSVARSPRVGIRQGREHHWRFYQSNSPCVSKHPNY